MTATRVAFVCQWYPPEPVEIPKGIVDALGLHGCDMHVLTGVPNYPTGLVAAGYSARSVVREAVNDVPVLRVPLYPSHDSSAVKRLLNYASWALSAAVIGQRLLRQSDVALVYSSPATAALPAMVANLLWRTPYVLLVQDVWPDSIFASAFLVGRSQRFTHHIVKAFVGRAYAMASHVVVISPGMADLLTARGVPAEKLSVVYNWLPDEEPDRSEVNPRLLRQQAGVSSEARTFLYAGNHGRAQALEPLVDAFIDPATAPSHLVMLGAGVAKQALITRAGASDRVHFLDPVTRAEARELSAAADVNVVSLADEPIFKVAMPSKVQAGLAAGRPMLVVSNGDSADLIRASGAGSTARPGDPSSIIKAVQHLASVPPEGLMKMGRCGVEVYRETMARDVGASKLAYILRTAARPNSTLRRGSRRTATHTEGTTT